MTDEEIRQAAINKIGSDLLDDVPVNTKEIAEKVRSGHSNLSMVDIDMIVQTLGADKDRLTIKQAQKENNCSQFYILNLIKDKVIRKLKPIEGLISKRDLLIAMYEAKLKRNQQPKVSNIKY